MRRALLVASVLFACERSTGAPAPEAGTARTLGMFSPELPDDSHEQARLALEQDAWRRENRFKEAVDPGSTFRATRISQAEIESGRWKTAEVFEIGAQLFHLTFTAREGLGGKDRPPFARFHLGRRGGPDASSCANCHWRGGPAGAGDGADNAYLEGDGDSAEGAIERNPIGLSGAGLIEIAAREMTAELSRARDRLVAAAKQQKKALRTDLSAKGVSFGKLGALPDGTIDASALEGVDADLVVKPFGWKGMEASLRDMIEDELAIHLGVQSDHLVASAAPERMGSFGGADPDGDGVTSELSEGQVTALTAYLAMQEMPIIEMPVRQEMLVYWSKGRDVFHALGCASCHVPSLELEETIYRLPSRTGGRTLEIDLSAEGGQPRVKIESGKKARLWLFSDLKRHEMGERLADAKPHRGIAQTVFLTPPLWGLARSRPYLHDASAPTMEDAILAHGGEAAAARAAFAALGDRERYPLRLYLATLTRAPRMVSP